MKFNELAIGDVFRFESEFTTPYSGMKKGPWRKIGRRKYEHVEEAYANEVGSWKVEVRKEETKP